MDMMQIRRGLLAQMAVSSLNYIKGQFTAVKDENNKFTLNFGKTFSRYLVFIEATASAKSSIASYTGGGRKTYSMLAVYPGLNFSNNLDDYKASFSYAPSTEAFNREFSNANITLDSSKAVFNCRALSFNLPVALYDGLTYDYFIVEV